MKRLLLTVVLAALPACGGTRSLQLEIHPPCNGSSLETNGVAYVELAIASPELEAPVRATFGAGASQGSLDDITAVTRATIEVAGRLADRDGGVGSIVVAGGVGYLNLRDGDERVAIVAGQVSTFVRATPTAELNAACTDSLTGRSSHSASLLDDGRVLLAGGLGDNGTLASSELYDPRAGTFGDGPALKVARSGHTATLLAGGRVLIAGGLDAGGKAVSSLEVFDGSAFLRPVTMEARGFHTATRLTDGRVLLAGGLGDDGSVLPSTAIYDPRKDSVVDGPTLRAPRARHAAVLVGDAVVALIGGIDDVATVGLVEFVDVDNDESVAGPALRTPRSDAAVGYIANKQAIVVAGGYTTRVMDIGRGTATTSIEVVSVESDFASSSIACSDAKLTTARAAALIAPVPHGFLVAGGSVAPGEVSNGAEALTFDAGPCRPTIDEVGALYASRFGGAATPLVSGDILVTGGASISKGNVSSRKAAEIFIVPR